MEIVEIFANSDPSIVTYFDHVSWSLGDVCKGILPVCQIQTEFVEYGD